MPARPQALPVTVEMASIRPKESVSMRATTAGMTSMAATRVTPMTVSVTRIDSDSMTMSSASMRATFTPEAAATSGSKVVKSSAR